MTPKPGRYSVYIRPLAYSVDILIIVLLALPFGFSLLNFVYFSLFVVIGWLFLSFNSNFYEIYRFTKVVTLFSRSFLQIILFALIVFSFFGIFQELSRPFKAIIYITEVFIAVLFAKTGMYYLLQHYRKHLGGNYRTTVIIGNNKTTRQLYDFFKHNAYYGYQCKKLFNLQTDTNQPAGHNALEQCFHFIKQANIDEIYCSTANLNNTQLKTLVDFADNNLKVLKFIPDNKDIYTKKLKLDYYDYLPILSFREIPLEEPLNKFIKRLFDILLALSVILFILSWLTPVLAIIIKLTSKGPVFFKQPRNGLDYKEFYCYKFRSMKVNTQAHTRLSFKNDSRITPIGQFMRKTSIDELPQFFNVLLGNMSTVGPRPHMVNVSEIYAENIDKFMVRHFVKPGITGLAQVSGYRGEVESEKDIINRVKFDIFYIENWSLLLDIKIIFQTAFNILKGDKKAY